MRARSSSATAELSSREPAKVRGRLATTVPSRSKLPSFDRRYAIVAGAVSLTTLASWLSFRSTLPERDISVRLPSAAPSAGTLPVSGAAVPAPGGAGHSLEALSPQALESFRPAMSAELVAAARTDASGCREPMASLTFIATNRSQGRLRVISGTYTSPWYELRHGPMTFPIPFPTFYAEGKGVIAIEGDMRYGMLALSPVFSFDDPPTGDPIYLPVWWNVEQHCK